MNWIKIQASWVFKNEYITTKLPTKFITGPHGTFEYYPCVWVDGKKLSDDEIIQLAKKEGFDDVLKWLQKYFYDKFN